MPTKCTRWVLLCAENDTCATMLDICLSSSRVSLPWTFACGCTSNHNGICHCFREMKVLLTAFGWQFFANAKILKQVCNSYNTMDMQVVPSQRKMLEADIQDFIQVCNSGARRRGAAKATWNDIGRESEFIHTLKEAHDRLNNANRKLRKYHMVLSRAPTPFSFSPLPSIRPSSARGCWFGVL